VAARSNCSTKIVEAMFLALSQVVPDRVTACSHGQVTTCGFGGFHPRTGERFIFTDIQTGGNGGRPFADGNDGQDSHLPRFMNTPVEAVEQQFPARIEHYEFIPDTGGAGRYRGSLALRRDIRLLCDRVSFARYGDRHKFKPFGLFGGLPGSSGEFLLNPGTASERRLNSKGLDTLNSGDLVSLRLPGAGGYGDPRERDLAAIERDLRDEKISPARAEADYAVVVDRAHLRVDLAATERLRAKPIAAE
jgi:N-methylhydantoinase B